MTVIDWHGRWERGEIGFHLPDVNPRLPHYLERFCARGDRVLVPLCGKSVDLGYLVEQGMNPVGVELVERAARDFFRERAVEPVLHTSHAHPVLTGRGVEIHVADVTTLPDEAVSPIDAIWDRAALIALDRATRARYAQKLIGLTRPGARMLLVTLTYDEARMDGPPFSVSDDEVRALYGDAFALEQLERVTADPPRRLAELGLGVTESVFLGVRR